MDCSPPGFSVHRISHAGKSGVGFHFHLHGIFLIQGSNLHLLCLLHYRWILYHWATGETAKYKTEKKKAPISPRWHSCQAVSCVQLWEFFLGRLPAAELLQVSVYVLLELGQPSPNSLAMLVQLIYTPTNGIRKIPGVLQCLFLSVMKFC